MPYIPPRVLVIGKVTEHQEFTRKNRDLPEGDRVRCVRASVVTNEGARSGVEYQGVQISGLPDVGVEVAVWCDVRSYNGRPTATGNLSAPDIQFMYVADYASPTTQSHSAA